MFEIGDKVIVTVSPGNRVNGVIENVDKKLEIYLIFPIGTKNAPQWVEEYQITLMPENVKPITLL